MSDMDERDGQMILADDAAGMMIWGMAWPRDMDRCCGRNADDMAGIQDACYNAVEHSLSVRRHALSF